MREVDPHAATAATVTLACPFCGAQELLPRAAADRALALRTLNAQRRWADDGARGPAVALLASLESLTPHVLGYAVLALAVTGNLVAGWKTVRILGAAGLDGTALIMFATVGAVVGMGVATGIGVVLARRFVRTELTPLLQARPAHTAGAAGTRQTCRRCGAELPSRAAALVTCTYCAAPNLLSAASAGQLSADLARDLGQAHALVTESRRRIERANRAVRWATTGAFAIGAVLGGALGALAGWLVMTFF